MDSYRNKLVEDNFNMVYSVVNKYYNIISSLIDYDEAVGICSEALVKAAMYYDSSKDIKFSTYAYNSMKNNLLSIYNWQFKKLNNSTFTSLNEPRTSDNETLMSVIPSSINIEEDVVKLDDIRLLYKYIDELSEYHKKIIILHLRGLTFDKIGTELNRSPIYVYSQYQKAINKLRYKFLRGEYDERK